MPHRKKTLGGWGQKITAFQLNDALQSNRNEFLELCRRVTCDEAAANSLLGVVESILEGKGPSADNQNQHLLNSIRFGWNKTNQVDPFRFGAASDAAIKIEEEVNLIQLLAEVHLMTVAQAARKGAKT